jgi:transcriptional regulator with XRE-family HTH domain
VSSHRSFKPPAAPVGVSAIVRELFEIMNHQQIRVLDIADQSGVNTNTIYTWRRSRVPSITNFEAVANALGYKLCLVEMPPGGTDDLEDV